MFQTKTFVIVWTRIDWHSLKRVSSSTTGVFVKSNKRNQRKTLADQRIKLVMIIIDIGDNSGKIVTKVPNSILKHCS